ncbi:hypothetical protein [Krasilnikovia sp. MM14-A1259]|uniref:hypothetical protein n=1 Tax=Krasilnikovia sp. MM14-A1259 TaxID=3373539 RepID=UPI00382C6C53
MRQAMLEVAADERAPSRDEFVSIVTGDDEDLALRALQKAAPLSLPMRPSEMPYLAKFVADLVPRLPDAPLLTGNVRSTATAWIAALLQQATVDNPAQLVTSLVDAAGINAIAEATRFMIRDRQVGPVPALQVLLPHVAEHARTALLANFSARDDAELSDLVMTMVDVLEEARMLDTLRTDTRAGLDRGAWTPEDLAARFVTVHQMVGGSAGWKIDEFQPDRFIKAVHLKPPVAAATGETESKPRPGRENDTASFDRFDVTWPNRRLVARRALERLGWI